MWSTPNEGTSPCVAFRPTRPHCAAGILVLPPESAPSARSASPAATAAAEPPEEPPAEWDGRSGLRGGPKTLVTPKPEPEKSSRFVLPTIVPPASSTRSTTTASTSGVYESVREPFVIGMPATATESFTAIRRPASGPPSAPWISQTRMKALTGSSSDGRPSAGLAGVPHRHRQVGKILHLVEKPQEPGREARERIRLGAELEAVVCRRALQVVDRRRPQVAHVARMARHRRVTPQPYCASEAARAEPGAPAAA